MNGNHERYCKHCDTWYPLESWDEDEHIIRNGAGVTTNIIRTASCPACRSINDPYAAPLRDRP
jgi:hypothetical protein